MVLLRCLLGDSLGLFGPLGRLLGPLESFLGASWGILAASWRPLGVSWRPLEASWGDLGSSWGEIGVVLGDFWSTLFFYKFFGMILEAKRVPKGRHFGRQNGAKINKKSRCKFKSGKVTSWSHLGSISARFPSRLGVKNIDFSLVFKTFREHQCF